MTKGYTETARKSGHMITLATLQGNWVEGTIDGLRFQAKVFNEGSEYGINEGRVSKLMVWDEEKRQAYQDIFKASILNYDRGWDIEPSSKQDREILKALLDRLENLPGVEV